MEYRRHAQLILRSTAQAPCLCGEAEHVSVQQLTFECGQLCTQCNIIGKAGLGEKRKIKQNAPNSSTFTFIYLEYLGEIYKSFITYTYIRNALWILI